MPRMTLAELPAFLLSIAAEYARDECWPWPRAKNDRGYGQTRVDGRLRYVHILSYEAFVGPIPAGLEIDHRCHDPQTCVGGIRCPHRPCFNFRHLKAVTSQENSRRSVPRFRTHCPNGHPYDEKNTARSKSGRRVCRKCRSAKGAAWKKAQRAARGPIPPKTHCSNGHLFDEQNTYVDAGGHRHCRACKRDHMRRARGYRGAPAACPKGHPYDDQNTYIVPTTGHRQCRACKRERMAIARSESKNGAP
jgi:hypothetical protein